MKIKTTSHVLIAGKFVKPGTVIDIADRDANTLVLLEKAVHVAAEVPEEPKADKKTGKKEPAKKPDDAPPADDTPADDAK